MKATPALTRQIQLARPGYALITVLMVMALMTVMIVSLFTLTRDDRTRARSYMEVGRSRFLVDMASQEILAKLMDGSMIPYENGKAVASYTAAPGVIEMRKYKEPINKGYHKGRSAWTNPDAYARNSFAHEYEYKSAGDWQPANPLTIPLYSQRWFAPGIRYMTTYQGNVSDGNPDYNPARVFNINTPNNPFAPGSLYISGSPDKSMVVKDFEAELGNWQEKDDLLKAEEADGFRFQPGEAASDRPLNVQWMPIYKFAGKGPVYKDDRGRTRRNPVVGRYSYWVDVENTKVNINISDRKFVDTELSSILGETEALNSGSGYSFYFVQSPNMGESGPSEAVNIRAKIERTLMNATGGNPYIFPPSPDSIIDKSITGRGDNAAAIHYHRMWMDWREDGTPPYVADNSLIDWRAFTGLRPFSDGLGEDTTIEGLLADAAVDNDNRFNTFAEVYSLLDPKTEQEDPDRGLAALTAMRRTYGNAATIYGWDEERDPLGLPKIDIVKLQTGGVDGPEFIDLFQRLKDPDYYLAYHTGADPSGGKSFARGFNALIGDNDPDNDANGDAAVRQMLVNIVEYGKPHTEAPYIDEGSGIVGAKSMPYVTEVATRARNGFWRLQEPVKNADGDDEDAAFDTMAADFSKKVTELSQATATGDPVQIELKLREVVNYNDLAGTFRARSGGKPVEDFVKNVAIDLNAGMANPNPFAEKSADRRNAYFSGSLKLNYSWEGITPIESPGAAAATKSFEGLYVARAISLRTGGQQTPIGGIRADGESVYFDLGLIPGETMSDPTKTTALRIEGWEIRRGGLFHKVPIRHPGQNSPPRPWWAMAQPNANPGQIASNHHPSHSGTFRDGPDYFSLASFYQPYNIEYHGTSGQSYQWEIPNVPINPSAKKSNPVTSEFPYEDWKNVSVGWFTARTMAEHCRTYDADVVAQGLPGCLYVSEEAWEALTSEWQTVKTQGDAAIAEFLKPDGKFARAVHTLECVAVSVDQKTPAMVERVVALDPTIGHRTGNPDAYQRANGGHLVPDGLPIDNVGHFYGTNGHPWRLAAIPPGPPLGTDEPVPPSGTPTRVPVYQPIYGEEEITYKTPVGNTYITTTKTIRVKVGEEVVGHRTVYPNKGSGGGSRGPIRQNYTLTENFHTPKLTSVAQGDLFGDVLAHIPLQLGWETECIVGGSKYPSPRAGTQRYGSSSWGGFFTSAPKGDLMVSIGEIGFCHSGLLGRPIELTKKHSNTHYVTPPGWWDSDVPYVGSPKHGLAPSTMLDLLTPGAFRENATGKRYSQAEWRAAANSNTPDNPRRGTWNMNAVPASDTYMAIREGTGDRHNQNVGHQSRSLAQLETHPVWAPNGHGMRKSWGDDRGWLDPMMNPFPRYRRGLESWLAIMVGDYTPFRSRGEAMWGRVEIGGAYAALSAPWFSWRAGIGATGDPSDPTIPFDPEYNGAASSLLAMGRISIDARDPNNSRRWTNHGATGLFYIDQGYDTTAPYHDPRFPMADTARTGNFPLRHHNSELISVSAQDITELHTALNPKNSSVGWTIPGGGYHRNSNVTYGFLSKYGTYFQPYQNFASSKTHNGHPGSYVGTGIYANAPVVLSANQVSTSANVFTAHIVTQAIRDNGNEREDFSTPAENTSTGLGYMDMGDEVLGEQWSQVIIARIPGEGTDPDTNGPKYDYRILYSRTLDHQVN